MVGPILFAVYVATFVVILYTAEHFLSTRWSMLRSLDDVAPSRKRD
jgi:hypothetical protein